MKATIYCYKLIKQCILHYAYVSGPLFTVSLNKGFFILFKCSHHLSMYCHYLVRLVEVQHYLPQGLFRHYCGINCTGTQTVSCIAEVCCILWVNCQGFIAVFGLIKSLPIKSRHLGGGVVVDSSILFASALDILIQVPVVNIFCLCVIAKSFRLIEGFSA